jgi:hypothetical protein
MRLFKVLSALLLLLIQKTLYGLAAQKGFDEWMKNGDMRLRLR